MKDDFLWDGSGESDPELANLEGRLSALRYDGKLDPAALPDRDEAAPRPVEAEVAGHGEEAEAPRAARASVLARYAVAGLFALAAGLLLAWRLSSADPAEAWRVEVLQGAAASVLQEGEWLQTDADTRVRLEVADIGEMIVDPGSRLRLARTGPEEHRLELRRGRVEAAVIAPPRLLVIDTPSATAVDLGCVYVLEVDGAGAGRLEVISGVVALETPSTTSRVIAGSVAEMAPGRGPTAPWFTDAPETLVAGLRGLHEGRPDALSAVLVAARPRDTLSLWHVLQRVPAGDRRHVFERLVALAPGVLPTDEDAVARLDPAALEILWRDLAPTW